MRDWLTLYFHIVAVQRCELFPGASIKVVSALGLAPWSLSHQANSKLYGVASEGCGSKPVADLPLLNDNSYFNGWVLFGLL